MGAVFTPDENRAYAVKVVQKQKKLDEAAATAVVAGLASDAFDKLVAAGRAGDLATVHEVLA